MTLCLSFGAEPARGLVGGDKILANLLSDTGTFREATIVSNGFEEIVLSLTQTWHCQC